MLNLECCISERGRPWEAPGKPFYDALELTRLGGTQDEGPALEMGVRATPPTVFPPEDKAEIVELICTTGKTVGQVAGEPLAGSVVVRTAPAFL